MVFLFIAFLGIIVIFVTPVPIGLNLFYRKKDSKLHVSLKIFSLIKYIQKTTEKEPDNATTKAKKMPLKIRLKKPTNWKIFNLLVLDKFLLEIRLPLNIDATFFYPIRGLTYALNNMYDYYSGDKNRAVINLVHGGESLYFQGRIYLKINLFMIFSIFFQIIKMEVRRKHGSD